MPKIQGASVEEHREQLRSRVFDAFGTLMRGSSYEAISMARLASEAGIGRTAIYHHFPTKESVVVGFARHETSRYLDRLRTALESASGPRHALQIYIRHHLAAEDQFHMGLGTGLYALLSPSSRLEIRDHVLAVEEVLRDILRSGNATGEFRIDDLHAAMSLIHACLGPRNLPPAAVEDFVLHAVQG